MSRSKENSWYWKQRRFKEDVPEVLVHGHGLTCKQAVLYWRDFQRRLRSAQETEKDRDRLRAVRPETLAKVVGNLSDDLARETANRFRDRAQDALERADLYRHRMTIDEMV